MALSLNRGSRGLLIDPTNGQADLANRELRGANPYIFFDDPSRIFRLIRFQHTLGFEIAPRTQSQLENALMEGYEKSAPVAALAAEIRALAESENAVAALESFDRLGLLKLISPTLTGAKLNTAGLARFEKALHTVQPPRFEGRLDGVPGCADGKTSARGKADLLRALALSKKEADALKKLEGQAKKLESALKSSRITKPSHVYDALCDASTDEVLLVLYDSAQRVVQDRIRAYYQKYLALAQEVTEEQVAATGVKPGTPKFEKAYRAMVTQHINARPKKIPPPEPEVAPASGPPPMAARK